MNTEMNTKTRQRWFPVFTITWNNKLYRFVVTREDVNRALGLAADHELSLGLSDTQMAEIASRCGEYVSSTSLRRDTLRTVLGDLGICDSREVNDEDRTRIVDKDGNTYGPPPDFEIPDPGGQGREGER